MNDGSRRSGKWACPRDSLLKVVKSDDNIDNRATGIRWKFITNSSIWIDFLTVATRARALGRGLRVAKFRKIELAGPETKRNLRAIRIKAASKWAILRWWRRPNEAPTWLSRVESSRAKSLESLESVGSNWGKLCSRSVWARIDLEPRFSCPFERPMTQYDWQSTIRAWDSRLEIGLNSSKASNLLTVSSSLENRKTRRLLSISTCHRDNATAFDAASLLVQFRSSSPTCANLISLPVAWMCKLLRRRCAIVGWFGWYLAWFWWPREPSKLAATSRGFATRLFDVRDCTSFAVSGWCARRIVKPNATLGIHAYGPKGMFNVIENRTYGSISKAHVCVGI